MIKCPNCGKEIRTPKTKYQSISMECPACGASVSIPMEHPPGFIDRSIRKEIEQGG